jgi:hypothetical protein
MTPREPTLQQRDTLAALVGRPISYFAGLGLPVYALVSTWSNRDSIVHPALAAVALLLPRSPPARSSTWWRWCCSPSW